MTPSVIRDNKPGQALFCACPLGLEVFVLKDDLAQKLDLKVRPRTEKDLQLRETSGK